MHFMIKLAGVIFLVSGFTGVAFCICEEQKNRLKLLKEMKYMYQVLQNEIRYTRLPLPEIFRMTGEKLKEPYGSMLQKISSSMTWEQGDSFQDIWGREILEHLKRVPLNKEQKSLLLQFPESTGSLESEGQARVLERFVEELSRWITQIEEEQKNKNKVIMSLGIAGGIFLSILLL